MRVQPDYSIILARVAIAGTIFFALVMFVVFSFVQPELNPLYRFGSEYAVGRMGWLMKLAFFVWSLSLLAFAGSMLIGFDDETRSFIAIALFVLASAGILGAGIWDSDLQVLNENPPPRWIEPPDSGESVLHNIASFVGLFSLMGGAGLVSRRLRKTGRLAAGYRALRPLSWVVPLSFIAFAAYFVPHGLAGIGQRIFIILLFAWLVLAARGIIAGAFTSHDQNTEIPT